MMADFVEVANVIVNYSDANIPLETMWTDIGMSSLVNVCVPMLTRSILYRPG